MHNLISHSHTLILNNPPYKILIDCKLKNPTPVNLDNLRKARPFLIQFIR